MRWAWHKKLAFLKLNSTQLLLLLLLLLLDFIEPTGAFSLKNVAVEAG